MKIGILGTGAYGMALASVFHGNSHNITMWTNSENEKNELMETMECKKINYGIPSDVIITTSMEEVVKEKDIIVIAVPAKFVNNVSQELGQYYKKEQVICIASKGIEQNTCLFLYDVVKNNIKTDNIAVISGGTFATDIIMRAPIGLSLATNSDAAKEIIIESMQNDYLKLRYTDDIIGTEICGSIKNVIAIASGILEGMKLPESTTAMFITESLHDIKEIIKSLGGDEKTILSFAGFGDLLLTCTSQKSRNYKLGKIIGEGKSKEKIECYINNNTTEGLYTLKSIKKLLNKEKISIPAIDIIYDIVIEGKSPKCLVDFLVQKK